jgi:hypothetical protein
MLAILSGPKFKHTVRFCLLGFSVLFLVSCETPESLNPFGEKQPVPACPKIRLLKDMDIITVYRPGSGRDITDIRFGGEIIGFKGECEYIGKRGVYSNVVVVLKVDFKITRGPAEKSQLVSIPYFIAIPEFYPSASGRSDFNFRVNFPKNKNLMRISDQEVEISIPLTVTRKGPNSKIYIGFQLTPDQLEFNRKRRELFDAN